MVIAARVWAAHLRLVGEGRTTAEAAALLGYADVKTMTRHIRAVTAMGPAAFRYLAAEECREQVVRFLRRTAPALRAGAARRPQAASAARAPW